MSTAVMEKVRYGSREIEFSLLHRKRKTLGITVFPDSSVRVTAPNGAAISKVKEKVRKRGRWILENQVTFATFRPKPGPREFVGGETHRYLGRQYRLKIVQGEALGVRKRPPFLHVIVSNKGDGDTVEKLVTEWYRHRAQVFFTKRMEVCMKSLGKYGIQLPEWGILKMKKRWGSCSPKGKILLNPELIKAPTGCIDYVIMHELCHLKHSLHDKRFFNLLATVLPDWQKRKSALEKQEI